MKMKFYLHENKLAGETHCHGHKNGFARKVVFTPWQRELENDLFCQTGEKMEDFNLVKPACDYAVAMTTLTRGHIIKY